MCVCVCVGALCKDVTYRNRDPRVLPGPYQPQFLVQVELEGLKKGRPEPPSYLFHKGTCKECHFATFFSLVGDQLFADGELVKTSEGSNYQPLLATPAVRDIEHGFSLEYDILQWEHPSFSGGRASFCLSTSNTVLAIFNNETQPADCAPANLVHVPCKLN